MIESSRFLGGPLLLAHRILAGALSGHILISTEVCFEHAQHIENRVHDVYRPLSVRALYSARCVPPKALVRALNRTVAGAVSL